MRKILRITVTLTFALFFTAGVAFAQQNTAVVDQKNGTEVEADVDQTGQQNQAEVLQGIETTINRRGAKKSKARIKQVGNQSEAAIWQGRYNGFSAKSEAKINQNGTGFFGLIAQGVGSAAAEQNNFAKQRQRGNNHQAVIAQGVLGGEARSNDARQRQSGVGSANKAVTVQGAGLGPVSNPDGFLSTVSGADLGALGNLSNFLDGLQAWGSGNSIPAGDAFAENNTALQVQDGSNITGVILQGVSSFDTVNNTAEQYQSGSGHTAITYQSGTDNTAHINQSN